MRGAWARSLSVQHLQKLPQHAPGVLSDSKFVDHADGTPPREAHADHVRYETGRREGECRREAQSLLEETPLDELGQARLSQGLHLLGRERDNLLGQARCPPTAALRHCDSGT